MEAVEHLARRAGINIERGTDFRQTAAWSERQLVQRLHDTLLNTPPALSYAVQGRGWNMQTIRLAKLGFMPSDKRPLLEGLNLSDSWRSVIQRFPAGMLVYIHLHKGRLMYLSGRSIEGKKHYNPPRDLIGEKQPYFNHCYADDAGQVVVVEGQADAITFGEWGEQLSEGKALSDREEAVLQSLEIMTRNADGTVWLKALELREQVAKLLGQPVEQLGHAQWIAHILSRMHLLDNGRRKRQMDGVVYVIRRTAVIDMMHRYDVTPISNS